MTGMKEGTIPWLGREIEMSAVDVTGHTWPLSPAVPECETDGVCRDRQNLCFCGNLPEPRWCSPLLIVARPKFVNLNGSVWLRAYLTPRSKPIVNDSSHQQMDGRCSPATNFTRFCDMNGN